MKPYEEFGFKDERNSGMEAITRQIHSKESYYQFTELHQFDNSVPENVRGIWSLSLDLFNHIHFNYEFSSPSNLYALMAVEAALKSVMKDEIGNMEKETMGRVVRRFIRKYEKEYNLTKAEIDWFKPLVAVRNFGAHPKGNHFGSPFGQTMIPRAYDFIWGLFCRPMMILTPHSPFLQKMDFLLMLINEHPYVVHKTRKRMFEKQGLLGSGY